MSFELSIISISYKNPSDLGKTLLSAQNIKGLKFEHIVIDSSPEMTKHLQEDQRFSHIKWIETAPKGIYSALNEGNKRATGELIWHLHASDELIHPENLVQAVHHLLRSPESSMLFSPVERERIHSIESWTPPVFSSLRKNLLVGLTLLHPGIIFRRDIFEKLGPFETRYKIASDLEFILRFLNKNLISSYFSRPFARFNLGGISQTESKTSLREYREIIKQLPMSLSDKLMLFARFHDQRIRTYALVPLMKHLGLFKFIHKKIEDRKVSQTKKSA